MSPMRATWLHPRWLFSRRAAKALLWTVVLVAAAVGANVVGIYLVGSVAGWEQWLTATAGYFLVWRLCLYGATASMRVVKNLRVSSNSSLPGTCRANRNWPPIWADFSKSVTWKPRAAKASAAESPAGPAPTTATVGAVRVGASGTNTRSVSRQARGFTRHEHGLLENA